jgi:hypothetical protein
MRKPMVCLMSTLLIFTGCSKTVPGPDSTEKQNTVKPNHPVTLKFLGAHGMTYETFEKDIYQYVRKKLPHVTLDFIELKDPTVETLDAILSAGTIPDLSLSQIEVRKFIDAGLAMDLTPLLKKYSYNISELNPSLVNIAKLATTGNGKTSDVLSILPWGKTASIMVYNRRLETAGAILSTMVCNSEYAAGRRL